MTPEPPPSGDPQPGHPGAVGEAASGPSVWEDYRPPITPGPSPRSARRARRLAAAGIAVAVVALLAELLAVLSSRPSAQPPAGTDCSPAPCATDGSGLTVYVSALARLPRSAAHQPVDPAPSIVQLTVRFTNSTRSVRTVDPLDFQLRDASGVEHALLLDVGPACGLFGTFSQPPMSTLGPKQMCFAVNGAPPERLTLRWAPGTQAIDIGLTG